MPEITSRLSTALADRYRIERHLGEGGMATVYLAEDLKHKRKVAVKVLRPELAAVLGAERFVQEITTTANLQHPHILPLFDSGTAGQRDGGTEFLYYVMPYVEGETLRDKLNRETQLGIDEAVGIATAIADALDYAHRQGVIHRDIKPENILLHEGRPMVADFGIALAVSAAAGGRMTETGLSLGTPHYMSPEQATAEKDLTNRSDIYSLGCVLYEMLTGEPPHTGASAQAIIMKIVTEDAQPITELRKSVPPHVAAATAKSLEKLAADRFESAAKFAEALTNPAFTLPTTQATVAGAPASGPWKRVSIGVTVFATAMTLTALWGWLRPAPAPEVVRFTVVLPDEQLVFGGIGADVVLAPDGSGFVYVGPAEQAPRMLFSRSMTQLEAFPIPGSDNGFAPFFSPDGASVGFLTFQGLHTISLGGGPPVMLTDSAIGGGGGWGDDGLVYFTNRFTRGISRVPATGGAVETITIPDSSKGEVAHFWVDVLPGSKGAIFMIQRGALDEADIGIVDFATGEVKVAVRGTFARYASSGHIVYTRSDGALLVAPFDADAVELTGPSTPILEGLVVQAGGDAEFTVSRSGHLIYQTGDLRSTEQIVWVDRLGVEQVVAIEQRNYDFPRLSPDGSRVALTVGSQGGGGGDVFVYRFEPPTLSRLTFEGLNNYPTWSHDGRWILFTSDREVTRSIYQKAADGSGPAELVYAAGFDLWEGLISPDDRWLIVRDNVGGERTIHFLELGSDTALREFGLREFQERSPVLSPDGQWIAYTSDESGRDEIYVRPFPPDLGGKWQVSSGGGTEPAWAHSGRELFYRSGGTLMAVDVQTTPTFTVGTRTTLFEVRGYNGSPQRASYAVDRTDQRFLFVKGSEGSRELVVVLNWFEELKSRTGR